MKPILLSSSEWCKFSDITVVDAWGWSTLEFNKDWNCLIDFDTFYEKLNASVAVPAKHDYRELKKIAIDRYIETLPKLKMPVCPYCREKMVESSFQGYYESFHYWQCNCEKLPNGKKNENLGQYA